MRLFIDMDGTLAVWQSEVPFEDVCKEHYFENLPETPLMQEVRDSIKSGEISPKDIYILSAVLDNGWARNEKNMWPDKHFPEIDKAHRIFVSYGADKAGAVMDMTREEIAHDDVLLDDFSKNLFEWSHWNGRAVKYMNGINGTRGTWQGEKTAHFRGLLTMLRDTRENPNDVYITKKELEEKLRGGLALRDILPTCEGQECDFFTTFKWPERDDIVCYIPDYAENGVVDDEQNLSPEEISQIMSNAYTKEDFVREAFGNELAAKDLWGMSDWQTPNIQDLLDCTNDDEAKQVYGETWDEMRERNKAGNKKSIADLKKIVADRVPDDKPDTPVKGNIRY